VAGQREGGLDGDGVRRHAEDLPEGLELRVELGAARRLVDHRLQPLADQVGADADAADPSQVERARDDVVVAGVEAEAVDGSEIRVVRLLDVVDALDLRQLGEQVVRHVRRGAGGDVVEDDRPVGRRGDRAEVGDHAAPVGAHVVRRHAEDGVHARRP
jgi:hypothetical protein